MAKQRQKPAVLVISSHVARGSVGNRAAVFALETFGYPVWAVPTILLPWHPGHGPSTRLEHNSEAFSSFMKDIASAPWVDEIGAVLTGYMADAHQVETVAGAIASMKQAQPDMIYVCDPVIGDNGGLYVSEDTAAAIRDHLIPLCQLATPNSFELSWMVGAHPVQTPEDCVDHAQLLNTPKSLITSCPGRSEGLTGNVFSDQDQALAAWHEELKDPPNGPGDLTAATFLAHLLDGVSAEENLKRTTSSVLEILRQSTIRGSNELTLESDAHSLVSPRAQIISEVLERKAT